MALINQIDQTYVSKIGKKLLYEKKKKNLKKRFLYVQQYKL